MVCTSASPAKSIRVFCGSHSIPGNKQRYLRNFCTDLGTRCASISSSALTDKWPKRTSFIHLDPFGSHDGNDTDRRYANPEEEENNLLMLWRLQQTRRVKMTLRASEKLGWKGLEIFSLGGRVQNQTDESQSPGELSSPGQFRSVRMSSLVWVSYLAQRTNVYREK